MKECPWFRGLPLRVSGFTFEGLGFGLVWAGCVRVSLCVYVLNPKPNPELLNLKPLTLWFD